jgi:tetratricopeptide (TPR) repeat protein
MKRIPQSAGRSFPLGASGRLFLVGLLLLAGCKKDKAEPIAAPSSTVLEEPKGNAAADDDLRAAQAKAKGTQTAEAWVALAESWLRHARASGEASDFLSAEAAASKAEELGAKNAAGLRALSLINRHRFEEARQLAETILAKQPEDLRALTALSDALLELGRLEESATAVQKLVDLKPSLPSYARASWLRWLTGDVDGAKNLIRSALDAGKDPRDGEPRAWTLCQAAFYFWSEGDYAGEAGYDQALALVPDYPPALIGKARCALSLGQASRALPLISKAFKKRPTVEAAILLAQALEATGASSGEAWKAAVDEGKRNDPLGLGLVYALRNEHLDEARALLEKERSARPSLYVLDALGWTLHRLGREEEAEEAATGANRFGTRDARLWYHLGAIKLARANPEGKALIEKALKLNPEWDPVEAADARKLLGP